MRLGTMTVPSRRAYPGRGETSRPRPVRAARPNPEQRRQRRRTQPEALLLEGFGDASLLRKVHRTPENGEGGPHHHRQNQRSQPCPAQYEHSHKYNTETFARFTGNVVIQLEMWLLYEGWEFLWTG